MNRLGKYFRKTYPTIKRTIQKNSYSKRKVTAVLYEAGESAKNPKLLGCKENGLGLRPFLESKGFEYVTISDKEKELEKHLKDTEILITTPFHPAYVTKSRIEASPKLKLSVTAGVGSDHIDLPTARKNGVIVTEVTGSNVVSVAEHVVMQILALVRNFVPAHNQIVNGEWDVAKVAENSYDLEGKVVGTVGCGRIGQRVLQRLAPFDCKELLYYDYSQLDSSTEKDMGVRYISSVEELVKQCDIVTVNCPLHADTEHLFNKKLLSKMKKGSYLVNTSRGKIVEKDDLADSLKSGHLGGYAGDVWYPQPAPADHVWRNMPKHAMTPHCSGTTLDAQARYAAGVKDIITRYLEGKDFNLEDVIVFPDGKLAAQYDKSQSGGKHGKLGKGASYNLVK